VEPAVQQGDSGDVKTTEELGTTVEVGVSIVVLQARLHLLGRFFDEAVSDAHP
jgi:hypothetical protein